MRFAQIDSVATCPNGDWDDGMHDAFLGAEESKR